MHRRFVHFVIDLLRLTIAKVIFIKVAIVL